MNKFMLIGSVEETPLIKRIDKEEYIEFVVKIQRDAESGFDIISCVLPIHFQSIIKDYQKGTIVKVKGSIKSLNNERRSYDLIIEKLQSLDDEE